MGQPHVPSRVVRADELLAGHQELVIEHQHRRYRLRRTADDLLLLSPRHSRLLRLTSTPLAAAALVFVGAALILGGWLLSELVLRVCLSLVDQIGTRGLVEMWRGDAGTTTLLPDGEIWRGRIRDAVGQTAAGCVIALIGLTAMARGSWVLSRRFIRTSARAGTRREPR
jgi:hypothetical protein